MQQQQQRSFCPLSSVSAPTPPERMGQTKVKNSGGRVESTQNGSNVHGGCASSTDEEHVIQASTYALWEQLYAPARVPLTMERLLYLRLSAKGNSESNDVHGRRYCTDDLQWAGALFGEIASQSDASTLLEPMVPSAAFAAVAGAPATSSRGVTSIATTATAMTRPLRENEEEEEMQQVWRGSLPDSASNVAVQPTEQCTAADVEQASVSTPLRGPCAFPDLPPSARPGWMADTAAPVQAPPQLKERRQPPLTSSPKTAEPALEDVAQMCANPQSASGVDGGHAPEPQRATTTISHCGTVTTSVSESSPLSVQCRSDISRDVDKGGDDSAALLRPCRGRTTSAASPPDLVLPASTSNVSLPSATPRSLVSAVPVFDAPVAQAVGNRKETAIPMSLERDDSNDCTDGNEDNQPRDDTWSAKAASAAQVLPMHTSSISAATVRADDEECCDGVGNATTCSLPSEHSACRDDDKKGRRVIGNEEEHAPAQQDEALQSCGACERDAATTTPVRPQHQCHHRSLRDVGPSAESGGHIGDGAEYGEDSEDDDDVEFLSITTSPVGVPEQRRSRPVGCSCAGPPTSSRGSIGVMEGTTNALVISVLPGSFKRSEEAECQLDSPTRRRVATGVSASVSPTEDLNGLVCSPSRQWQIQLRPQRRRPHQPSEGSEEEHSHLTPVPGSPSSSSCSATPHSRECRPWDSQTPPAPAALFAATLADGSADATDRPCRADAAGMHDSPPPEIHMKERTAMVAVSSIVQEGHTSATAIVKGSDADPRNGTALVLPVGAPCSAEAAEDGRGWSDAVSVAPVGIVVEKERAGSKEAGAEEDAGTPASMASLSCQQLSLALPARCGVGACAKGVPESHAGRVSSDMKNAASDSEEEALRAANAASASVAAAPVTPFTLAPSPPSHDSHGSFCPPKREDVHQERRQKLLPEDKAARRSVSSMDFPWADEADDVLRRQQQRLRSLQAARTATLVGADARRSPSTTCCDPRRYVPLSQEGGSVQGTQDGNGPIEVRRHGGSEVSHSVSPQPQDPRAHPFPKGALMGPGSTGVGAMTSYTEGSGIVTELGGVAPSSNRADRSKELSCLTLSRSGEGGAAGTLASASASPPPTSLLQQPTLTAVAAATAAGNAPSLRTGPLFRQQHLLPYHAGAKRLRESHDRNDDSSDLSRTRRSPAPSSVTVSDQTAKTKRKKSKCSGDAPPVDRLRRRQCLRGDTADKTAAGAVLSVSPGNVFALPRTISAKPSVLITAPPPNEAAPLSLLRSRGLNGANAPASTAQTHKSVRGKAACTVATPSPMTAATQPPRENASTRPPKTAPCATHRAPSLVPLSRPRDEEQRHQ